MLEVLINMSRKINNKHIYCKELKLCQFAVDIIVYVENSKQCTKNTARTNK